MSRRRRGRSLGLGYLALIVILLIVLFMITGRLQLEIIPRLNFPELGTPQALVQTPQALLETPAALPIPPLPSVIVLPPNGPAPSGPAAAPPAGAPGTLGQRTKTSGCVAHNALPDSACTPGAVFSQATKEQICVPGYTKTVRDVPNDVKDQVYAEYGIVQHSPGQYEVDHLVPLELGGSNDIANLWPEAAEPRPGFHEKDMVENYLHDQMCAGAIPLRQAQTEIATNWLAVYQQMAGK
jgi:hypothetical protein